MTELEERLERAERLLKQARMSSLLPATTDTQQVEFDSQSPVVADDDEANPSQTNAQRDTDVTRVEVDASYGRFPVDGPYEEGPSNYSGSLQPPNPLTQRSPSVPNHNSHPSDTLDSPPIVSDGFEWDEQYIVEKQTSISGWSPDRSNTSEGVEEDPAVVDGMASLTIGESEGGYLGVASGAAVLRLIDPRAASTSGPRKATSKLRPARILSNDGTWPELLCEQLDPNRHIVDSMIDAYFGLYHISYPIVHEPTFRAQYSELIERPNGNCWKFLAYVIAAVGVFTTSNTAETADLALFAQAKSLMHLSYLESGNLTLIQALGLMSNYLQRKDMPNSGYNYLGLATRMAMGLGLHKEFQGWSIPPLKMEIRRRVWWCLAVFDIGATITYGRPVSWPAGGVDVALPLNIDDRVGIHEHCLSSGATNIYCSCLLRGLQGIQSLRWSLQYIRLSTPCQAFTSLRCQYMPE